MEIWKTIKDTDGHYEVSSLGRVRNAKTKRVLKAKITNMGYESVELAHGIYKWFSVHRLVAEAFLENPSNLPIVNHKDENKKNNKVENLEWCTTQYNVTYGKCKTIKNRKVVQMSRNGELIKEWDSMKEAAEALGITYQGISRVCRGLRQTHAGYRWKYKEAV